MSDSERDLLNDALLGLRVLRSIGNARSYKVVGTTKCPNWGEPIVESCDSLIERIEEYLLRTGAVLQSSTRAPKEKANEQD